MIFNLMSGVYKKVVIRLFEKTWWVVAISIAVLYVGGWLCMVAFGEQQIVENFTWWFSVTITTVGYGDYSPTTSEGRFVAGVVMFLGIGIIGLVIGKLAEKIIELTNRKTKGLSRMSFENHIIIAGYRKGSTEKMVAELLSNNPEEVIVLCSSSQESNPFQGKGIHFVKGELSSIDVLDRSNASKAKNFLIHGKDDDQTFFTAYAVREINTSAHLVCCLQNEDHVEKIRKLPANDVANNQVVLPANIYLMAQELQDKESCTVIQNLISNLAGDNMYRLDLESDTNFSISFKDLFINMKEKAGVTVIAVKDQEMVVNPSFELEVKPGMAIFYTGSKRLQLADLEAMGAIA